ncbi:hypothetical protein BAE44_0005032 [Dichanthelium oligosanthes]|uniref:MATH domain-containing protein n=1 Tax=Dichanthelium oligosanthes TaxID=888268 RepID=A0A1E5W944_9POAL|nr:hypothetical protein BAE44_0005032 [Dichanthelium oligosanthes]
MEEVSASTVAAMATTTGHHLLKLEGYRRLKSIHGNGKYFESCQFEAAGHTWKLRCYPNGDSSENAGFFSLYLVYDGAAVYAEVELALVYHHRKFLPRLPPYSRMYTNNFGKGEYWWGFGKFIRTEAQRSFGFLKDDCLAVRCKITVVETSAVKNGFMKAQDMEMLGMLCKCDDDLCKRHHLRF